MYFKISFYILLFFKELNKHIEGLLCAGMVLCHVYECTCVHLFAPQNNRMRKLRHREFKIFARGQEIISSGT